MSWAMLTNSELCALGSAAKATMLDRGQRGVPVYSDGPEPGPASWEWGMDTPCGIEIHGGGEGGDATQHAPGNTATLRLPLDVEIASVDRWRVTRRHGRPLEAPEVWAVNGAPQAGISAQTVELVKVTGVSVK